GRQNLRQRLLGELSHLVAASLEPRQVHRRTLQAALRLVDCEAASLLLRDAATGELFFEVSVGGRASPLRRARLRPGEGIAGWVVAHGKPLVVHDCRRDKRWSSRVDRQSSFRTRDMICVPVLSRGETLGTLQAINKRAGRFDREDLGLMQTLSDRVAVALDNARLFAGVQRTLLETSAALAESIEVRDAYTGGHTRRVVEYSLAIGRRLGLPEDELEQLRLAAILHDIGKIGVDDRVLRKPGALEGEEVGQMRRHPQLGVEILNHVRDLAGALPGIRSHHERYDGRGYPDELGGQDIPRVARIIAVADTFDAMTSDRPYRRGLPWATAMAEIRRCAGSQFDPLVARACLAAIRRGEFGPVPRPRRAGAR
ncbi:MAG TPA: HD domain-containing protein, partial [Myxococcota bacterium]|nr:HD domain-containing protein [Myxococcota bacterium]